jgi:hypothetical protein
MKSIDARRAVSGRPYQEEAAPRSRSRRMAAASVTLHGASGYGGAATPSFSARDIGTVSTASPFVMSRAAKMPRPREPESIRTAVMSPPCAVTHSARTADDIEAEAAEAAAVEDAAAAAAAAALLRLRRLGAIPRCPLPLTLQCAEPRLPCAVVLVVAVAGTGVSTLMWCCPPSETP